MEVSETEVRFKAELSGLASFLFSVLRPKDARVATVNASTLRLAHRSRCTEIPIGDIVSVEPKTSQRWCRIRIHHAAGRATVSGLSRYDARAFTEVLETARVHWWRRTMAAEIATLRSVHERLTQLASPPEYMARSVFRELRRDAEKVTDQFADRWPKSLTNAPEIRLLRTVQDFLEDSERLRAGANSAFVANELSRLREFFDRIEARPLTEEQRRAVVSDEDRNLVVAAAGSGKTSVIVAKAGWLLHRSDWRPSELLLLAFAKYARNEMEVRVRKHLGDEAANGMTVKTFHSLGMAIIGEAEGKVPALARSAEDEKALLDLLKSIVTDLASERKFLGVLLKWFQSRFAPYRSEHEFRSQGEYWDYIRRHEIRSLKGEKVRSYEECEIANFLYLNGVPYEYERVYEHDTATPKKGPYKPDFYLTEAGHYIEHFGLNASGDTAPHIPREKYLEEMEWKRRTHAEHGTVLIETFSHEHAAGRLTENLTAKLRAHEVTLSPIPRDEVFAMLNRQGRIDPFMHLLTTFLKHFKGARLTFREVARRAGNLRDRLRAEAFLALFRPIFERYEETLSRSGEVDFHDMINRATDHVETGRYRSPFGYILVDEFQDISSGRARLLKALLKNSPGARLFAVGDDWQAIYRFAGSDIGIMREFAKHFGGYGRIDLETTFRCADRIASVATEFILRNPAQIPKTVDSVHRADGPCVHIGLPGEQQLSLLNEALDRIAEDAAGFEGKSGVLLLGRYNQTRPQNISALAGKYPMLEISCKTVHGAKGLEADYVVVLGLCSGKYAFPTEFNDDSLLDLVLAAPEEYPNAEERRLFYVAITRARRRVFLLAEGGSTSPFVTELIDGGYDVTVFGRSPEDDIPCPVCIKGRLEKRENKRNGGIFYGCSNYPYCEHTQRPCPACGKGLLAKADEAFRCRDCGQPIEVCPDCDGWLQEKVSQYGPFLGCSNYPTCEYIRDNTKERSHGRTSD